MSHWNERQTPDRPYTHTPKFKLENTNPQTPNSPFTSMTIEAQEKDPPGGLMRSSGKWQRHEHGLVRKAGSQELSIS